MSVQPVFKCVYIWGDHYLVFVVVKSSSSSSCFSAGQRLTPHSRTLGVRPGRINKKLEIHYDYDVKG